MSMQTLALVVGILGFIAWSLAYGEKLPKPIRDRSCQGREWREAFPDASKQEIRDFLSSFVSAFAFKECDQLKLSPDDEILNIYRALYPSKWMADAMEVETLAHDVKAKYGLALSTVWHEHLTVGEVFAHALLSAAKMPNPSFQRAAPPPSTESVRPHK